MLAFIEVSIDIVLLAGIILVSFFMGFFINRTRIKKQQSAILKLEAEMLQNHAEILHLQKKLSDRENLQSKTPVFSMADNASESLKEHLKDQVTVSRLSKKVSGG